MKIAVAYFSRADEIKLIMEQPYSAEYEALNAEAEENKNTLPVGQQSIEEFMQG